MEGSDPHGLGHQLGPEAAAPVEGHEEGGGPQVIGLVVLLSLLPHQLVLDQQHQAVVAALQEVLAEVAQEEPDVAGGAAGGLGLGGGLAVPGHPPGLLAQVVGVALQVVQPFVEHHIPVPDGLEALQDVGATEAGMPGRALQCPGSLLRQLPLPQGLQLPRVLPVLSTRCPLSQRRQLLWALVTEHEGDDLQDVQGPLLLHLGAGQEFEQVIHAADVQRPQHPVVHAGVTVHALLLLCGVWGHVQHVAHQQQDPLDQQRVLLLPLLPVQLQEVVELLTEHHKHLLTGERLLVGLQIGQHLQKVVPGGGI